MAGSVHPQSEKNYGEPIKYDPDFRGPLNKRSCTDILCLIIFVAFIVCWIGIGVIAFKKGDSDLLLVPKDSYGQRCGHDTAVRNKPYLFFFDITKCAGPQVLVTGCKTPQVCVEKCPKSEFFYDAGCSEDKLICKYEVQDEINKCSSKVTSGDCAKWYLPSTPGVGTVAWYLVAYKLCTVLECALVTKRCMPDILNIEDILKKSNMNITIDQIKDATKNIKYLAKAEEWVSLIAEDIIQSWWKILLGFLGAIIVTLIYIILMRWIAKVMVWFSIFGVIAILAFCVYQSAVKYKHLLDNPEESNNTSDLNVESLLAQKNLWLTFLIVSSILLILSVLVLIFLRKRIVIAVALIREGSKAVSSITSTLFFPIFPWIFQILVIAYAITVGLYLTSIGDPVYKVKGTNDSACACPYNKIGDICEQDKFVTECSRVLRTSGCEKLSCSLDSLSKPAYVQIFHAINVVGGFWGVFFVSALGEMILAATFATWYWTFNKSDVPFFTLTAGMLRTLRYHIGTLAFGSLIITICRLIRVAIEYIDQKLKKYDNEIVKAILCCCKCFFWCLEKFLKFINKNAYIMCAIHGKNFCTSARDAFSLLMRNIVRVFVVDKVTDMLFFLGKLLITAAVGIVAYTAFTDADFDIVDTADLHYVLVPVIIIAIGTYFISSVFFGVYSMAVDTLFLCFLEDCERNDGSPEKPYYMSKELMKILGKKNKQH